MLEVATIADTLEAMAAQGGGTLDLTTGAAATLESGYYVGGADGWQPFILGARPEAYVDNNMAEVFAEFVGVMVARLNGRGYIGVWEHNGSIYLDATEWYADRSEAVQVGAHRGEIAVWDIANGAEIALLQTV